MILTKAEVERKYRRRQESHSINPVDLATATRDAAHAARRRFMKDPRMLTVGGIGETEACGNDKTLTSRSNPV